ncbi:3'-5' exonuclease [uncultured Aquimonas sp.]|uniref:3'-5' exonuclease n=1 Tax=uncultured Aquimonas sp. TaxID=385483 RepID=UPI00086987B8|nr:3'-5' exonuclease [uncultured Aquimonas sp.]ODU48280.1 MAG: DNA helicase [Xanthomonadaceae bacterium SCN 69-123]
MARHFRIADTFTDSLARLTGDEQKAVKTTAFDLQLNPANPGMSFHKLDNARDSNFWSVRVSADIRLIVHRSNSSLLLCYVDHHDRAYRWAERRKLDVHPKTGAAQFVEIRERVEEVRVPRYVDAPVAVAKPALFASTPEQLLLGFGVPPEWMGDVRQATEDSLLDLVDHLPAEAAEALLELATGGEPKAASLAVPSASPFEHPDAQRRFRVVSSVEELERALSSPWDKWTIFLHPEQRQLVERDYAGPARVSGSAGTGKTIVALHRAAHLARSNPDARVLLTTFSVSLANALRAKLRRLISAEPRLGERIDVLAMDAAGIHLHETQIGPVRLLAREDLRDRLSKAAAQIPDLRFGLPFLFNEWEQVVDAWQLSSWEEYRDVKRLGRKTRLSDAQRQTLWQVFDTTRSGIAADGMTSMAGVFTRLAALFATRPHPPFEHVVVDEAQDISIAKLRFLAAIGKDRPNALFLAGDLGQRIFQVPFSWKAMGVDVRGRSRTLSVNYRTSHQIRACADRLLGESVSDVDGLVEVRKGTVSVFNGPVPQVQEAASPDEEIDIVANWIKTHIAGGMQPHEIGVIVRSSDELERAGRALSRAAVPFVTLDERMQSTVGKASACTMHLAKGLEFRAVAVMACDDEVIPSQERIEQVTDDSDLAEVYATERHLLYVACTRAREELLVTGVAPMSEFLDDLRDA